MITLKGHIFNEHCRFKLKSGKEVYGIIWQVSVEDGPGYFFTSASQKEKIETSDTPRATFPDNRGNVINVIVRA